jgi:hypothetical protein
MKRGLGADVNQGSQGKLAVDHRKYPFLRTTSREVVRGTLLG